MEPFLSSYGLDDSAFREKMIAGKAVIAGSSALSLYLKQEGVEPGFEPNDMDIFLRHPIELGEHCSFMSFLQHKVVGQLAYFFIRSGYNVIDTQGRKANEDYEEVSQITMVISFEHPFLKTKIQLICVKAENMIEYIRSSFDCTACMTWWDPSSSERLHTHLPELTLQKKMVWTKNTRTETSEERRAKYEARGFELLRSPPPFLYDPDTRRGLENPDCEWTGKTAFDCIHHEEVDVISFLRKSPWNIIIRTGETDHAFDRETWSQYLESKKRVNSEGITVYSTPFLQAVTEGQRWVFDFSDWSIYELTPIPSTTKETYYTLTCYCIMDSPFRVPDDQIAPFSSVFE
jgi:hypothetical protein